MSLILSDPSDQEYVDFYWMIGLYKIYGGDTKF
jgi:hypothetical protein